MAVASGCCGRAGQCPHRPGAGCRDPCQQHQQRSVGLHSHSRRGLEFIKPLQGCPAQAGWDQAEVIVAKAAPAEQFKLLELQGLDAKLRSLANRRRSLEADPRITDLEAALSVANGELGAAKLAVHDAEAELKRAEADVEQVAGRIERDEARLNSGTGLSKDLVALQKDIASLNKRRSDLEDVELEVLERLDSLRERQAAQQKIVDDIQGSFAGIRAELDEQLAEITAEETVVRGRRAEFAAGLDDSLVAVYEKTLARRGVGAARLFHGTSEGSGMQLSPGDLAEIKAAAEDDIVFCPDSGCILVRSAEWV